MKPVPYHYRHNGSDDERFGTGDADPTPPGTTPPGDMPSPGLGAKPVFSMERIVEQLQTQWGGDRESNGYKYEWAGKTVYYAIARERSSDDLPPWPPDDGAPDWIKSPWVSDKIEAGYNAGHMTDVKANAARLAFELWDDLIRIDLTEGRVSPGNGIAVAFTDADGAGARAYGANGRMEIPTEEPGTYPIHERRIWIETDAPAAAHDWNFFYGNAGLKMLLHEIGHGPGLSHPGTYDSGDDDTDTYVDDAEYVQDTGQFTVMSYFRPQVDHSSTIDRNPEHAGVDWAFAATPLLHDIAAIQDKYGADMSTRAGATTYGFNITADLWNRPVFDFSKNVDPVVAIWDGGGIDTLDVSGFKHPGTGVAPNQHIDLRPGAYSDIGFVEKNVAIAYNCDIENAIGGGGNDTIVGNDLANRLEGGLGEDIIRGGDRNDTLLGGRGNDRLLGGADNDTLDGGADDDTLTGGTGRDWLAGGLGADTFVFQSALDSGTTAATRDVIADLDGRDLIDLRGIDANGWDTTDQAFSLVGRFTGHPAELWLQHSSAGVYVAHGDVTGDGKTDFSIEIRLAGITDAGFALRAADYFLL
jgi:serralysin